METQNAIHPGAAALATILADTGSHHVGYLAIQYLNERLEAVEKILAERNRSFKSPEPQEITDYAKSINFTLDGSAFCDYYQARNWCVGKVKMKDWKAAVRTWKSRRLSEIPKRGSSSTSEFAHQI